MVTLFFLGPRSTLKISTSKQIILYGAQNPQSKRKGWDIFVETLKKLDKSKYFLLIFGNFWSQEVLDNIGIEYKILGFIDDDASKIGTRINNIQINSLENYLKLINSQLVKIIYVTIPSISFEQRKYLVRKLLDMNIPFKFLNLNEKDFLFFLKNEKKRVEVF